MISPHHRLAVGRIVATVIVLWQLSAALEANGLDSQKSEQDAGHRVEIFDTFEQLPALPQALQDGFVDHLDRQLLYVGGHSSAGGKRSLSSDVLLLAEGADTWQLVGQLPDGLAGGASVRWGAKLLLVGGLTASGEASANVLSLNREDAGWQVGQILELPFPMAAPSAALIEDPEGAAWLYISPATDPRVFAIALQGLGEGWTQIPPLPLSGPVTATQLIDLDGGLYAFGRAAEPFALEYAAGEWKWLASPPTGFEPRTAMHSGDAHLLFVGPPEPQQRVTTYHRVTDAWAAWAPLPSEAQANRVQAGGKGLYLFGPPAPRATEAPVVRASFSPASTMHVADYAALLMYFVLMVALGVFFARRNKDTSTYFEGGRSVAWLAVGMSMFATGASSISFMAMPAKAFSENWKFFIVGPLQCLILPISLFVFIPILRRERISTAYEYLERRFSPGLRVLGASFFAVSQVFVRISVVMYLPAIAMESFTGIDKYICILMMGGLATLYTTMGGLEAVIWTDVLQGLVMIVAVMMSFGAVLYQVQTPVGDMLATAQAYDKFHMVDWGVSFEELSIWVMLLSLLFFQAVWCSDQNYVQRVQSVPSERLARKAAISQLGIAIPINVLFFGLGTLLFICYRVHPDWLHVTTRNDAIFPYFVVQNLPIGLTGVIIAALFAASMSSLDSSINSSAMVLIHDFYRRFKPNTSEADAFRLAHRLSLLLGLLGTVAALLIASLDRKSAWDLFIELSNLSAGSIMGIYTLGYFTRRAHATGAWIGWVIGNVVLLCVWQYSALNPWLYGPVGITACFLSGYLVSLVTKGVGQTRGLTVFTISPENSSDDR